MKIFNLKMANYFTIRGTKDKMSILGQHFAGNHKSDGKPLWSRGYCTC